MFPNGHLLWLGLNDESRFIRSTAIDQVMIVWSKSDRMPQPMKQSESRAIELFLDDIDTEFGVSGKNRNLRRISMILFETAIRDPRLDGIHSGPINRKIIVFVNLIDKYPAVADCYSDSSKQKLRDYFDQFNR